MQPITGALWEVYCVVLRIALVEEPARGRQFFFQAEDGIRALVRSRGLGDVYKRQFTGGAIIPRPERFAKTLTTLLFEAVAMKTLARGLQDYPPAMLRAIAETTGVALTSNLARRMVEAVSYTHLTLPTIDSV